MILIFCVRFILRFIRSYFPMHFLNHKFFSFNKLNYPLKLVLEIIEHETLRRSSLSCPKSIPLGQPKSEVIFQCIFFLFYFDQKLSSCACFSFLYVYMKIISNIRNFWLFEGHVSSWWMGQFPSFWKENKII